MDTLRSIVKVVHIVNAILMAWPFYALVMVNQRARLGPPLGDRADLYMENAIKNRTVPCFVFQGTALVSGFALVLLGGQGAGVVFRNPVLGVKLLLLLFIAALLAYVHVRLQPQIDSLFSRGGNPVAADLAPRLTALRLRRKRIASVCLFVVLVVSMLGVQVWAPLPVAVTVLLIAALAAFTWRAYRTVIPYGWA